MSTPPRTALIACLGFGSELSIPVNAGETYFLILEDHSQLWEPDHYGIYDLSVATKDPTTGNCSVPDGDGDGITLCDFDCSDSDPNVRPGAEEVCDGLDNDCSGIADDFHWDCDTGLPGICSEGMQQCDPAIGEDQASCPHDCP